jgi:hypothetical protein
MKPCSLPPTARAAGFGAAGQPGGGSRAASRISLSVLAALMIASGLSLAALGTQRSASADALPGAPMAMGRLVGSAARG